MKDLNGKPDMKAIKSDWENDSNGRLEMNYAMFYNAIFELVDVWCEVRRATHPAGDCVVFFCRSRGRAVRRRRSSCARAPPRGT